MAKYPTQTADGMRDRNNFEYHPAAGDQAVRYQHNREGCRILADVFRGNCPPSRELSLAITKLEEALFWANAAIARNESHAVGKE